MAVLALLVLLVVAYLVWRATTKSRRRPITIGSNPNHHKITGDWLHTLTAAGVEYRRDVLQRKYSKVIKDEREGQESVGEGDSTTVEAEVFYHLEDENPHDKNAVAVVLDSHVIGYVPKALAPDFRTMLRRLGLESAQIKSAARIEVPLHHEGQFAVELDLPKLRS